MTIKQRRGLEKNLPKLEEGQLALTTDQKNIYMGSATGNVKLAKDNELQLVAQSALTAIQHINVLSEAITGIKGNLATVENTASVAIVQQEDNNIKYSGGADYAEYFEWADDNHEEEDRVGFAVALEGRKIRKATSSDVHVLGIISSNPSVIGDASQDNWKDKYVTDEWERIQYEWKIDEDNPIREIGEDGQETTKLVPVYTAKLNPYWNPDEAYKPRAERKEWSPVGLVGKLLVREDGTSAINGYVKVGAIDGEVTASSEPTNMIVLERVSNHIVRLLIK